MIEVPAIKMIIDLVQWIAEAGIFEHELGLARINVMHGILA